MPCPPAVFVAANAPCPSSLVLRVRLNAVQTIRLPLNGFEMPRWSDRACPRCPGARPPLSGYRRPPSACLTRPSLSGRSRRLPETSVCPPVARARFFTPFVHQFFVDPLKVSPPATPQKASLAELPVSFFVGLCVARRPFLHARPVRHTRLFHYCRVLFFTKNRHVCIEFCWFRSGSAWLVVLRLGLHRSAGLWQCVRPRWFGR